MVAPGGEGVLGRRRGGGGEGGGGGKEEEENRLQVRWCG